MNVPTNVPNLIASLQSMRDRMMPALTEKFGDAFDGDFDVMLETINTLKRFASQPTQAEAPSAVSIVRLSPLPAPDFSERAYGGYGNEIVYDYFEASKVREYARQEVYRAEETWRERNGVPKFPSQPSPSPHSLAVMRGDIS